MSDKESSDGSHVNRVFTSNKDYFWFIIFLGVRGRERRGKGQGAEGGGGGAGRGAGARHQDAADSEQEVLPRRQGEQAGKVYQGRGDLCWWPEVPDLPGVVHSRGVQRPVVRLLWLLFQSRPSITGQSSANRKPIIPTLSSPRIRRQRTVNWSPRWWSRTTGDTIWTLKRILVADSWGCHRLSPEGDQGMFSPSFKEPFNCVQSTCQMLN